MKAQKVLTIAAGLALAGVMQLAAYSHAATLDTAPKSDTAYFETSGTAVAVQRGRNLELAGGRTPVASAVSMYCGSSECTVTISSVMFQKDPFNGIQEFKICSTTDGVDAQPPCQLEYGDPAVSLQSAIHLSGGVHALQTYVISRHQALDLSSWQVDYNLYAR